MPHQALKLLPGVNTVETPALNEAGISSCNLIRYKPDFKMGGLVEKLGGWGKFYGNPVSGIIRALWAYEDTDAHQWIVYGTSNTTQTQLAAIECFKDATTGITTASTLGNNFYDITPSYLSDSVPVSFQTVSGSSIVTVTDSTTTGVTQYDVVYITTPVSVGGIVLFGMYAIATTNGTNQYTITATNVLGNPTPALYSTLNATINVSSGSFTAGTPNTISLVLSSAAYTFIPGEAVVLTGISPLTWNGSYIVQSWTAGTSTLVLITSAGSLASYTSGGRVTNNGVVPQFATISSSAFVTCTFPDHGYRVGDTFYCANQTLVNGITLFGGYQIATAPNSYTFTFSGPQSASVSGQQYANATTVTQGSSTSSHVTLTFDDSEFIVPTIVPTGGTASGSAITLTWTTPSYTFTTGATIVVSGINPSDWNGTVTVASATSTSVTYSSTAVDPYVSGGTIINAPFAIGASIVVSGIVAPTAWNGNYLVTGVTASSVTYANTSGVASWGSGGSVSDIGGDVDFVYSIVMAPLPAGSGYGVGGYGVGGYGFGATVAALPGQTIWASNWDLSNWGDDVVALPVGFEPIQYSTNPLMFGPIYIWSPLTGQQTAQPLYSGPPVSLGAFVAMPQRQIIAWGSSFSGIVDTLLIRWCDVNNFNTWAAQVTNQAGSFRLPSGASIMGGLQTAQQGLIWTDIELWSMQYTGPPYVYNITKIGEKCGLIARRAMGSLNGTVFWMGANQFFMHGGEGVVPLECPVWDQVFQNLDLANAWKTTCGVNGNFQEVTWYYPVSGGNGENSAYVKYNMQTQTWDYGLLDRSAWIDTSVLGPPIGYSTTNQYIYQHEISDDADGQPINAFFTTGWFALADGDQKVTIDQLWPDFKYFKASGGPSATIDLTLGAAGYPEQTPYTVGPFALTSASTYISPRIRGRLAQVTVSSSDTGTWWRLGAIRYRSQPDGRF